MLGGRRDERRVSSQLLDAISAKRAIGNERDAVVSTVLRDAVAQTLIVEWRQTYLHGADWRNRARRFDLSDGNVAQPNVPDDPVRLQPRQRTNARLDRRFWIDHMELV